MGMEGKRDYYLIVLLLLAFAFVVYWSAFGNYRYTHYYDSYYDMGTEAYSAYWHINGLHYYSNPFQFFIFATHLSFSFITFLPFYALYQQPISLFVIQAAVFAATALVLYLVSSDLLRSRKIAFALAIAFLVSPAVRGALVFDFHPEMLMPLFYILSFYFYAKRNKKYFAISFALLLGVLEVEVVVGATLIAGLLLYELLYNRKNSDKRAWSLLGIAIVLDLVFFIAYHGLASYLPGTYANSTTSVVPTQRFYNYLQVQANASRIGPSSNPVMAFEFGAIGLGMFFTGFGLSSFVNPLISLILYSTWWGELVVKQFYNFAQPLLQYYLYGLGGSVVAALLGLILIKNGKVKIIKKKLYDSRMFEDFVAALIIILSLYSSATMLLLGPLSLFTLNYAVPANYTSIDHAIGLIPANANVCAQGVIAVHLTNFRNLELPQKEAWNDPNPSGLQNYWFLPDYVILSRYIGGDYPNATILGPVNLTRDYTLIFNQSGTNVYKRLTT